MWTVAAPTTNIAREEWGTQKRPFNKILQSLLEQRPITVTSDGAQDLDATLEARAKAEEIQERFSEWLWEDPERTRRLTARYNDQFNGIALRTYDGQSRQFPGMSEEWQRKSSRTSRTPSSGSSTSRPRCSRTSSGQARPPRW